MPSTHAIVAMCYLETRIASVRHRVNGLGKNPLAHVNRDVNVCTKFNIAVNEVVMLW